LAVRHPNIAGAAAVLAACRRGVVRTTDGTRVVCSV
jgi:hypothetical protein